MPTGESSLARAIRILDAFTPAERTLTVSQIAMRAGLHVGTASRLIAELAEHGLLERTADRRVGVGMRLWELASRASPTMTLREAALPYLEELHATLGHHVQLAVLDNDEVLFVERLSARDTVINFSRVAGRLPVHAVAPGLVFLAYGPQEVLERVVSGPLRRYTDRTIGDPTDLLAALEIVRGQGYAVVSGTVVPEAAGVAAPVRNALSEVVAAVSVVAPNDPGLRSLVPATVAAARGISRVLSMPPRA